jgi:hypothetical protein
VVVKDVRPRTSYFFSLALVFLHECLVFLDGGAECRMGSCRHHLLQLGFCDAYTGFWYRQIRRHRAVGEVSCCFLPPDVVLADREGIRLEHAPAAAARRAGREHWLLIWRRLVLRPCSVPRKPAPRVVSGFVPRPGRLPWPRARRTPPPRSLR